MSQEQRYRRLMQASTGGITFNGVPLPPLTPAVSVENGDDVDVDARSGGGGGGNGKRKLQAMGWDWEEEDRRRSGKAAVYSAGFVAGSSLGVVRRRRGGGGQQQKQKQVSTMFATRERERRKRLSDTFAAMRRLLPNLRAKSNKVEVVDGAIAYIKMLKGAEAQMEAQRKHQPQAAAAVTVAVYDPDFGVAAPATRAAATAPAKARGAVAPTPRPVGPTPPPPFAIPVAQLSGTNRWPFATAVAPEMPPPAPAAVPVASLKTWAWGANVVISVMGNIGNLSVRAPARSGAMNTFHAVLQRYTITVLTSLTATDPSQTQDMLMLYTNIDMPNRPPQFENPKVYEAMYRAAGAEIAGLLTAFWDDHRRRERAQCKRERFIQYAPAA